MGEFGGEKTVKKRIAKVIGKEYMARKLLSCFSLACISVQLRLCTHALRAIVFTVRKQWDYCCKVLISMAETIVCSHCFRLTELPKE